MFSTYQNFRVLGGLNGPFKRFRLLPESNECWARFEQLCDFVESVAKSRKRLSVKSKLTVNLFKLLPDFHTTFSLFSLKMLDRVQAVCTLRPTFFSRISRHQSEICRTNVGKILSRLLMGLTCRFGSTW